MVKKDKRSLLLDSEISFYRRATRNTLVMQEFVFNVNNAMVLKKSYARDRRTRKAERKKETRRRD